VIRTGRARATALFCACGFALSAAGALVFTPFACSGPNSHVYIAQVYDTGRDCLSGPVALDVIAGADPGGSCSACLIGKALLGDSGDAGASKQDTQVYIGTSCPPFPVGLTQDEADARCLRAQDAKKRKNTCQEDGGGANPVVRADGG
jgi:hypothetical protein